MFELYLLDKRLNTLMLIENYQSVIWTERYSEPGDFEIYTSDINAWKPYIQQFAAYCNLWSSPNHEQQNIRYNALRSFFIRKSNTKTLMIVEDMKLTTDVENGTFLTVSGRSLESILDRRLVYPGYHTDLAKDNPTDKSAYCGNEIVSPTTCIEYLLIRSQQVLTGNLLSGGTWNDRTLKLTMTPVTDPRILNAEKKIYSFDTQSLLDAIESICSENCFGFQIFAERNPDWDDRFVNYSDFPLIFKLNIYMGNDVSDLVTFAPKFDNFINSELSLSSRDINIAHIVFAGNRGVSTSSAVTSEREYLAYHPGMITDIQEQNFASTGPRGIFTRETITDLNDYINFRDSMWNTSANWDDQYHYFQEMAIYIPAEITKQTALGSISFTGQAETSTSTFILGVDYTLGDIVMVENEFGISGKTQVIEIVESFDAENGHQVYPTFSGFAPYNSILK